MLYTNDDNKKYHKARDHCHYTQHFGKRNVNLPSAAPKVIILRLRHYQDSQVVTYIAGKL